jgi:hypothetical protein
MVPLVPLTIRMDIETAAAGSAAMTLALINVLQRARRDGVFIPWHYVCADYAVSGTLVCRRGYIVAKMLVERRAETGVAWFIIDDLGRMNRNALESLRLGELNRQLEAKRAELKEEQRRNR